MNILMIVFLAMFGCKKDPLPVVVEPPPSDTIMQLLWHVPCDDGTYQPIQYGDQVAWCEGFNGSPNYFVFRDTASGLPVWNWVNDVPGLQSIPLSKHLQLKDDGKLIWNEWHLTVSIDLDQRKTSWWNSTRPVGSGAPGGKLIGDYFYQNHYTGTWASSLSRTHIDSPNWDTLYTLVNAQWQTILRLPTEYINTQGDTLVIFIESQLEKTTNQGRINMVALDTKSREVVWRLDDYEPEGLSNTQYLEIHNGRIYKLGESRVWCIDAETGQIIWYRDFDPLNYGNEHFMGNNYALIHGDRIYAKGGYQHMEALDLETGQVMWSTDAALSAHYCLYNYKDRYIIYARQGGGGIAVHRLSDGSLVYKNNKIAWGATSGSDMAVDNVNDRIYWADGKFAYCFRLNLP